MARLWSGRRTRIVAAAVAALGIAAIATPAQAVVGGTPTGPAYANVGLLSNGCSGTLVSTTVVLTAAHCIYDSMRVTFAADGTGPWIDATGHLDPRFFDPTPYGGAKDAGTKAFLVQSNYDVGVVV